MTQYTKEKTGPAGNMYADSAEKLLRRLGANRSYKGFALTALSISEAIEQPDALTCICKGLYVDMAKQFNTTIYCIERNIRTLKQLIWIHGDRVLLEEIFGSSLSGNPPRNSVFIDKLAQYVMDFTDR